MGARRREIAWAVAGLLLGMLLMALLLGGGSPRGDAVAPERRPPDPAPPAEGAALPPAPPAPVPAPAAAPPAPAPPPPAPPPAGPPDPPPAEGPVLVHLRDAETGKPCPGVLVMARSYGECAAG